MKVGIRLYKDYISEDYNGLRQSRCMFAPTCSSYAQEAIARLGPIDGLKDGFAHLGECNTRHHAEQMSAFLGQLGQPGPMKLTFETPQIEAKLRQLEGQVEQLAAQAQKGPTPQLQAQFGHVVADMQENLHVATIQHPGGEPEGFHISASTAMATSCGPCRTAAGGKPASPVWPGRPWPPSARPPAASSCWPSARASKTGSVKASRPAKSWGATWPTT